MCRLLGVVAAVPAPLRDLLAGDLPAFTSLADEHCDGWGIAAWEDAPPGARPGANGAATGARERLFLRKEPVHAHDPGFAAAVDEVRTGAALLHLRKASLGMAVTAANTHPFTDVPPPDAGMAMAHNGFFAPREPVDALLERAGGRPCEGDTDSERYAGLVMTTMRDHDPVTALVTAAERISAVSQVESLNALLLTPGALYAYARFDDDVVAARQGPVGSYELSYRWSGDRVVVASNGWEQPSPRWQRLPNRTVLEIRRSDLTVTVHPG